MFLIAGLGNPGREYAGTRHNIGFEVMDMLAERYNINMKEKKHRAICGTGMIGAEKVILAKPLTYMNLSGESVWEIVNYYKLDPQEEMLVVFDDVSLAPGVIRVRTKGSAGGHNGIKSIIACLGTQNFMRVKVGVGEKPPGADLADHVLGRFSKEERLLVEPALSDAAAAAALMAQGEVGRAMNEYNAKAKPKPKEENP